MLNEDFLYYIWLRRLINPVSLELTGGEEIEILHPGYRNPESGPDFFNARLRINGLLWAGNVEIHVKASDWFRHRHQEDPAYEQVILHAVYEADEEIRRPDGHLIPCLEMKGKFPAEYLRHYTDLIQGPASFVPCSRQLNFLPDIEKSAWINRMLIERLEIKFSDLSEIDLQCDNLLQQSFYRYLGRAFGFKVNTLPFELLTSALPYELVQRHRQDPEELEALFFGQAGLLPHHTDEPYVLRLKRHFRYFRKKCSLHPVSPHLWKFGGLRPGNFPTLRISQFAMLHFRHDNLLDRVAGAIEIPEVRQLFDIQCSDYWFQHYHFGSASETKAKKLGTESIDNLLINAVIPFLFYYGKTRHIPLLVDKALYWIEKIPPENNRILKGWEMAGLPATDAGRSQALYHLKKMYCDFKKCVNCGFGQYFLGKT